MTRHRVHAPRWALLGKLPGAKDDYRILHGTPGLGHNRAWSGVPSTPQLGGKPGPGRLPWVTFTPRVADGHYWTAVTVIDTTDDRDAVGRPVVSIRYAELPFAELAREHACYRALYQAMPSVTAIAAADPGGPLPLDIDGTDSRTARVLADDATFDRAARVAALLLSGGVLVRLGDSDLLPLDARLAEFDQVLALLPFGLRASVTLASWHDGTQPTTFRLAFGEFAFRGQAAIGPAGPVPAPADGNAAAYLRDLLRLRAEYGTARVLEHLSRHRWPQERPVGAAEVMTPAVEAHEILCELADPELIMVAVRNGRASPGRVAVAMELTADRFDPVIRDEMESYLLAQGGSVAGQSVLSGWSERTGALAARVVLGELAAGGQSPAAWRLRAYAAWNRADDEFLAALAGEQTESGATVPPERIAACLAGRPPEVGGRPLLREAVVRRPVLARTMLLLALRGNQDPEGWLSWLDPLASGVPGWLRRYAVLFGTGDALLPLPVVDAEPPVSDDGSEDLALIAWFAGRARSLAWLADEWWPRLFTLARSRLVSVPPRHAEGPGGGSSSADRASGILADLVRAPLRSRRTLWSDVRSDTLRLYCGMPPAWYPVTGLVANSRAYLDALWATWSSPPAEDDTDTLTALLLTGVFRGTREGPRQVPRGESALALLYAVILDFARPSRQVADAIAEILHTAPYLYTEPGLTERWWVTVERLRPDVRAPAVRLRAAVSDPEADPADVAVLIGRAAAAGHDYAEIAAIAGGWAGQHSITGQRAILRIIQGVVQLAAARHPGSADDLQDLAALLGLPKDRASVPGRRR